MNSIKINTTKNVRRGVLFHYAPFILHSLFPEIINDCHLYDEVIRKRVVSQTVGNFNQILIDVLGNNHIELEPQEFSNNAENIIDCEFYNHYYNMQSFTKFRNFIFNRYNINSEERNVDYPEVLLIKRHDRIELVDDKLKEMIYLEDSLENKKEIKSNESFIVVKGDKLYGDSINTPWLITNGKERREIDRINDVEDHLRNKFGSRFGSVYLELLPFEEQIKYFNNAKFIVCAHGGGMANLFFCKPGTEVLEVLCDKGMFPLFNVISTTLKLKHIKCQENNFDSVMRYIK